MSGDFVSAVPGSGKTETLINKCYELMVEHGVESVVAITFTDRASEELIDRLKNRALKDGRFDIIRQLPTSNVGTIHNFCSRIVRRYGSEVGLPWSFRVMDDLESFNFLEKSVRSFIIGVRNDSRVTEEGITLGRILDGYETDVEQVIRDCTDIMESQKGYLDFMIFTNQSFFTSYSRKVFDEAVMKEISSKLKISIIPELASLLTSFSMYYQRIKQKARLMDFDDLLLYTLRIMNSKGSEIAKKFKYVLVDEFQDTDELQIAIFERFWNEGSSFFVVGDLNQSIYSFRGAHPGAQRRFSDRIANKVTLQTNRRSGKNLIEFFNRFFPAIMEYVPMEGSSEFAGGAFLYIDEDKIHDVAEIVKRKIREGESPGDIAILSRISSDFFNLKRSLKSEGLDCVLISGESILKSQEGLDVLSIVRYLADPGDKVAQVGLLLSPMFDKNISELLKGKEKLGEMVDSKLGKYREELKAERIDFILNKIVLWEGYVSALLGMKDGAERVSRLGRILELVSSHVSGYGGDAQSVAVWLQNAGDSKESGPIDDLLQDKTRVKVMTIHQAKGLEFNTVIVYDLRPGIDREKYYSDEYAGLVAKKDRDFMTSPSRKIMGKSEKHTFSLNEETRILYVAFTRARKELHLVISEKELKEEKIARKGDDLISILQRTLGIWKGGDAKERKEAADKMSITLSSVTKTEPIVPREITRKTENIRSQEKARLYTQHDDINERAIAQFLREKGDRISQFRVFQEGKRVTVSEKGIRIYEDVPVSNNYFVRNGKIEFTL
ncbi:MAG: ATP-dependent helicase [Candidatus Thermoplasmatota archaeon]|nr:ATP-dependent helicase [Candidatus Thermoplasmatota archaeon]